VKYFILVICLFSSIFAKSNPMSDYGLKCDTVKMQSKYETELFYSTRKGKLDHKSGKDNITIVITNLNSKRPKLLGNNGTANLAYIGGDGAKTFYIMEVTIGGYMVLYTFYTNVKKFTMTKQYQLFGNPYSLIIYGEYGCY